MFQGGRHELPKIRDLPQHMGVLVTQGISVNSSYSSDIKVTVHCQLTHSSLTHPLIAHKVLLDH